MNNAEDKYTEIIDQIKALQPQIADPQRLISKTMNRVEMLSKKKRGNKVLAVLSFASSIAASVLIGLFLFETYLPLQDKELQSSKTASVYVAPALMENMNMENPLTLSEFNKILNTKKQRRQEQRTLYLSLIDKYKNL